MKSKKFLLALLLLASLAVPAFIHAQASSNVPDELMGHRFLTINSIIRVNQIEVRRDNMGFQLARPSR